MEELEKICKEEFIELPSIIPPKKEYEIEITNTDILEDWYDSFERHSMDYYTD